MKTEYNTIQYPRTMNVYWSEDLDEICFHFRDGSDTRINIHVFEQMIRFLEFLTEHDQTLGYLINSVDKIKEKLNDTNI